MDRRSSVTVGRGTGTGPGPKGIRHLVPAAHVIPASGGTTPTVAQIDADARKAEMALLGSDVLMTNVRWLMNPREVTFLRDLRDANGNLVYPGLSQPTPTWKGSSMPANSQC